MFHRAKAIRQTRAEGVISPRRELFLIYRRIQLTMLRLHRLPLAVLASFALLVAATHAQQPTTPQPSPEDFVRAHYTKYEYRIPMRDGKRLFTAVYVPKDAAGGPYPFLMERTPYDVGPYGEDQYPRSLGPSEEFEKSGYIFVYQDVRGRWMSEGEFQEMRPHIDNKKSPQDVDDASDTYDTIEFLLKHVPNNNGKAGIWGISYPGFYTSASMIDSHPALVAASPQAPMTDLFLGDDAYHGGAFMLAANFGFYNFFRPQTEPQTPKQTVPFDFGTPDTYKFYLKAGNIANLDKLYLKGSNWLFNDQSRHATYDAYWQARDLSRHMKNIHCAVLVVGRMVRRGRSQRPLPYLLCHIEVQPGDTDDPRRGTVGSRRLVARRRQPSGRRTVQCEDERVLPREYSVSVL